MTLELASILPDLQRMVQQIDVDRHTEGYRQLEMIWNSFDPEAVDAHIADGSINFLHILSTANLDQRNALPSLPPNHTVIATDGSHMAPNRHSPVRFFLINIGRVVLRYGELSGATLDSVADLRYEEDDLYINTHERRISVNEALLGIMRTIAELEAAADLAAETSGPTVVLVDGTLTLWMAEAQDETVKRELLERYLMALDRLREAGAAVAGYISAPAASEIFGAMRVAACDYPGRGLAVNCRDCWLQFMEHQRQPACNRLAVVTDRYLVEHLLDLQPGERTAMFRSSSHILDRYGYGRDIRFCYLHTGGEVVRLEVPAWIADDDAQMALVHAVAFEQAQLGRGYPVALQEAHERAVLSMTDRQLVAQMVERLLAEHNVVVRPTGKDGSKRGRFI